MASSDDSRITETHKLLDASIRRYEDNLYREMFEHLYPQGREEAWVRLSLLAGISAYPDEYPDE